MKIESKAISLATVIKKVAELRIKSKSSGLNFSDDLFLVELNLQEIQLELLKEIEQLKKALHVI